jgi:hypothetical protein
VLYRLHIGFDSGMSALVVIDMGKHIRVVVVRSMDRGLDFLGRVFDDIEPSDCPLAMARRQARSIGIF